MTQTTLISSDEKSGPYMNPVEFPETARELGFELGELQITSQSAHIYEQDWDQALKLSRCFFCERKPDLVFDPNKHSDPRGNIIITVKKCSCRKIVQ